MMVRKTFVVATALAGLAMAGCDDDPTSPPVDDPIQWSATIQAEGESEVTGIASVEAADGELAASVEIANGTPDQPLDWYVGTGETCGDGDLRVGVAEDYPALAPDGEGDAVAQATLADSMDPEESYHVAVIAPGAGEEEDVLVACGVLEPEDEA